MMYDQPHNDFDKHEHGEDASSAAYDAEMNTISTKARIKAWRAGVEAALRCTIGTRDCELVRGRIQRLLYEAPNPEE